MESSQISYYIIIIKVQPERIEPITSGYNDMVRHECSTICTTEAFLYFDNLHYTYQLYDYLERLPNFEHWQMPMLNWQHQQSTMLSSHHHHPSTIHDNHPHHQPHFTTSIHHHQWLWLTSVCPCAELPQQGCWGSATHQLDELAPLVSRCHVTGSDVATKQQTMTSVTHCCCLD